MKEKRKLEKFVLKQHQIDSNAEINIQFGEKNWDQV
jgi:hypothetical protein